MGGGEGLRLEGVWKPGPALPPLLLLSESSRPLLLRPGVCVCVTWGPHINVLGLSPLP